MLWFILANADTKLLKQQLSNEFWQYLRIGALFWNLNDSTYFAFPIGTWKNLNVLLSCVLSWVWKGFLYTSGSWVLKLTSIQYKSRSNQRCDIADWPWNLNLASFCYYLLQQLSNHFDVAWQLVHKILVPLPFALCYFLARVVFHVLRLNYFYIIY